MHLWLSELYPAYAQMFRPCHILKHRMAPPAQSNAKQHGYVPLRAASPPRDSSTSREYPLNRRVSPGVEHRRPVPRGNPKVGKTTIAPGQVKPSLPALFLAIVAPGLCATVSVVANIRHRAFICDAAGTRPKSQRQVCVVTRRARRCSRSNSQATSFRPAFNCI